nr:unnamed protein product [Spirometra erinaceieuropaei]
MLLLLLLPSALYLVLCQAIVVANAQLLDPLDEIELPPPPPPPPEALAEAWPDAEGPLTAETPATAVLVMTALRLVPVVTGLNSFLILLILAIFVAALIFLLVFHVTLNWRPFQKGGRTGRRGSHTSLTLVLSPIIDSPHAAPQPSMSNPQGSQGSASFMGARGHRTNRFSPMAATTSPVSLHRPYGDEDSAALFCPEDRSHLQPRLRQPQQQHQQQRDHPGSSSSHQGASEGINTAAGTTADHEILCQSSLPLTGQQLEKKLREDVASLFSEFWSIPTNLTSRNKCGLAGVGQKNRYAGIIPNNETRVILPQTNNDELTTYINANYIHGYAGVPRAFIATQGPMTHTVNDFWRMIWHTRAPAIVMLTRLVESGKVKCEFYLPDSKFEAPTERSGPGRADTVPGGTAAGSRSGGTSSADPPTATAALFLKSANSFPSQRGGGARKFVGRTGATDEEETDLSRTCARAGSQQMFGSVLVRVDSVVLKAGYTKRFITLKQGDEEHKVTHFWYVAWPDHSSPEATPTAARHLLHLVHETEACRYARAGASGGHCIPQSLSSPSTPSIATGSPPPTLPVHPPSRRFQRQHAEERTDAEVVDLLSEEEETTDFYGRGYRASDPLAVATGPVVVHCSAGIGRTGCFIALCIGCEQLRREDKVDVFGIVNRLRLDRGGMVEDHSQYAFLHIALATFNSLQRGLAPPEFPVMDLSLGFPRPGR